MRIKNWKKFQHFKDRRPPWIKLHREILEQRDIHLISDRSFRVLILLWLLASEDEDKNGNLPSLQDISFRLRIDEKKITQSLQELGAWIDYSDIKVISKGNQVVPPETETETETEYIPDFDSVWNLYPKKDGKKESIVHFNATVKTEDDFNDILKALDNYKQEIAGTERKYIKNGSTWFNNWRDWVDYVPEAKNKQKAESPYGYVQGM